ncbi:MAG: M23 family metallopeptidase, partial [Candidatus Gracilibacteria bacterium]
MVFTDPIYEEWKDTWQSGTTALYDLNTKKGEIKDVCGKVTDWSAGHAYDGHQGWDRNIPNDNGVYPVFAIGPGIVEKMADDCIKGDKGCHGGAGNYVFMRHNKSVVSKFFHLAQNKVFVKSSQWVDRFHPIGLGGSTGNSDGEHVHVQIEIDGVAVDPISLAAQWSPPLVVDQNSCNVDPQHNLIQYQSLDQFVAEKFKAFSTTLSNNGYALSKKKYWLLDSHGVDNKDIIIEEYIKGGDKSALIYDLVGHGAQAIFIPHAVLKWWFEQGSVYGYGKPLASVALASGPNIYTTEFYFEQGSVKMTSSFPDDPSATLTASAYPDNVAPGMFADGWYAGKSYAFINSFVKNGGSKKVGYPTTQNSTTPFVHDWSGYSVQVFSGGSLGSCGIMLQKTNDNFQAFLIPGKIWTTYHAPTQGPDIFGAPINDVYFDTQFAMNRQDFEKGMSILESGEVITSS